MRIAVLTGGGDVPGLNAAIRALMLEAELAGDTVLGVSDGWAGLQGSGELLPITTRKDTLLRTGGTVLGSSRTNPIKAEKGLDNVERILKEQSIDALVAIGGDDTLSVAAALAARGTHVVGVPKTMDFDLDITEYCIGFDTAVSVATEALDRLQTTAASHHRILVLEVMGRDTGWVALNAGIAGGANAILLPEFPLPTETLTSMLKRASEGSDRTALVIVAEGYPLPTGEAASTGAVDAFGHPQLVHKGLAQDISTFIEHELHIETRATVLGHIQRGGTPTAYDRIWATRVGQAAYTLIQERQFGYMSTVQHGEVVPAKIADVAGRQKRVPKELFEAANRLLGVSPVSSSTL